MSKKHISVGGMFFLYLSGWWYHLFLCAISEHRLPTETCFLDGLLMDREERLDEWDNLCFGLESLTQPLSWELL